MYNYIDPAYAIPIIEKLINDFELKNLLPNDFPKVFILKALCLIMTHNIFQFGPTFWLQKIGTAMGTPVACTWATLYYGYHEINTLLPLFNRDLITLKRLIDDKFGCWVGTREKFNLFKRITNNFGLLKWEFSPLTTKLDFLDLHLKINNGKIYCKTYEKPHNLYQYIPYNSSHSPYCKNAIIQSLCFRYYHLNDSNLDYLNQVQKLYDRLKRRGYPPNFTKNLIIKTTKLLEKTKKGYIQNKNYNILSSDNDENTLIFKITYNNIIKKEDLKSLIKKHLTFTTKPERNFLFKKSIIAFKKSETL